MDHAQKAQTISHQNDIFTFSHRDPYVNRLNRGEACTMPNRPSSTVLMQLGEKDVKKMIKKKFDLANARQRDPTKAMSHSYHSKLQNPVTTSQKWREKQAGVTSDSLKKVVTSGLAPRLPQTPMLVQYQNALARENKNISPFMVNGPMLDPEMVTINPPKTKQQREEQKRLQASQSSKVLMTLHEPLEEHLKYSESMSTLKKLRDSHDA